MPALPSGTSSTQAQQIQRALNEKTGASLKIDGQFGPLSISALQKYQSQIGVPVSGIYDSATQAILGPFMALKYLGPTSFQQAAQKLGVDVATVQAVCQVEAKGAGFLDNGQCIILFERAQLYKQLVPLLPAAKLSQLVSQYPTLINTSAGAYLGGAAEWTRLSQAQQIIKGCGVDPNVACRACSWGLFQIMGYYFTELGYTSVSDYVNAMQMSESHQLDAFVRFVTNMNGGAMLRYLKAKDWLHFALQYNGQAAVTMNNYPQKLKDAYTALTRTGP
ncbi:N-acetylmuramidase domain-containing protein [Paraburkholderia adhaesiva]|uniref:N-acetylmuramidase domain-containing protein n=1 Tax=Paraburkholderia adhaesiva TaxID=2883244 RepID=UPI001F1C4D8B|nr:N-acetylmuramidase family protein [Paraburkholderia adhaesiva]